MQLTGFDPAHLGFASPSQTPAELEAAIGIGVDCIGTESSRMIDACARNAAGISQRAGILPPVNPAAANRAYGLKMGDRPVQFGIDEEDLRKSEARLLAQLPHLNFRAIHAYTGRQCVETSDVVEATRNARRIAREVDQRTGLRCAKFVNRTTQTVPSGGHC